MIHWLTLLNRAGCDLFQSIVERNLGSPGVSARNPTDFKAIGILTSVILCVTPEVSPERLTRYKGKCSASVISLSRFILLRLPTKGPVPPTGQLRDACDCEKLQWAVPFMSSVSDQEELIRGTSSFCTFAWRVPAGTGTWVSVCGHLSWTSAKWSSGKSLVVLRGVYDRKESKIDSVVIPLYEWYKHFGTWMSDSCLKASLDHSSYHVCRLHQRVIIPFSCFWTQSSFIKKVIKMPWQQGPYKIAIEPDRYLYVNEERFWNLTVVYWVAHCWGQVKKRSPSLWEHGTSLILLMP